MRDRGAFNLIIQERSCVVLIIIHSAAGVCFCAVAVVSVFVFKNESSSN